jgi:hypothetical protein
MCKRDDDETCNHAVASAKSYRVLSILSGATGVVSAVTIFQPFGYHKTIVSQPNFNGSVTNETTVSQAL